MFKHYPAEVKRAIDVLWNYSYDAYAASRTKKELSILEAIQDLKRRAI